MWFKKENLAMVESRKFLLLGLALVSFWACRLTLLTSYEAGCAGDTKGGAVGNINLALELEGISFGYSLLVSLSMAILIALTFNIRWLHRIIIMVAVVLVVQVGFFFVGSHVQTAGLMDCHYDSTR